MKLPSQALVQGSVRQTSVFRTFSDKTNVLGEVSTFDESSIVVDGNVIEGSMKPGSSLSNDSTSKDDRDRRETKSLVPDYNSDQSSNVDSRSNLSTENIQEKDKSNIPTKTDVILAHEASAETVCDVHNNGVLIPSDKHSDDNHLDHPSDKPEDHDGDDPSDKPSEDHDGDDPSHKPFEDHDRDHPSEEHDGNSAENTIVIP